MNAFTIIIEKDGIRECVFVTPMRSIGIYVEFDLWCPENSKLNSRILFPNTEVPKNYIHKYIENIDHN